MIELVRLHESMNNSEYDNENVCKFFLAVHSKDFPEELLIVQVSDIMGQSEFKREEKLQGVKLLADAIQKYGPEEYRENEGIKNIAAEIDNLIEQCRERSEEDKIKD